jgi:hypothetical protein
LTAACPIWKIASLNLISLINLPTDEIRDKKNKIMKQNKIWIFAIILSVIAGSLVVESVSAPTPENATRIPFIPSEIKITDTPVYINEQCAYMWAYHGADKLSAMIDAEIHRLNPAANGNASFYGEDCVYADGHSTFGAMETDFYAHIPAGDLTNEEALGNWISQVLQIVSGFPREEIQGKYGFVEFWFEKSESEHVVVRVPIQQYMDDAQGITGAALFRRFATPP